MPSASLVPQRPLLRVLQALTVVCLLSALAPVRAEREDLPRANYKQAARFSENNLQPLTYTSSVFPNWIGNSDSFWYPFRTSKGTTFWHIDPVKKTKTPLFDHEKLASQLAEISRKPVEATALPISRTRVTADGKTFTFVNDGMLYDFDLAGAKLVQKGKAPAAGPGPGPGRTGRGGFGRFRRSEGEKEKLDKETVENGKEDKTKTPTRTMRSYAPDRKSFYYVDKHNLYLAEVGKEAKATQLTKDGVEDYSFVVFPGFAGFGGRRGPTSRQRTFWSKDSKHFYALRYDSRGVKELFLVNSLASPRPTLQKYKYPMPGEESIRKGELHVGSRDSKKLLRIQAKWKDESYGNIHWGKAATELRFVRLDRLLRNLELCSVDASTGACKALISEGFENAPVDYQPVRYLDETDEMIWWSEKSGWGHFYLYDRQGKLKKAITSGAWRASRIVALDEKKRILYFHGNGREPGENVYYEHLYSINLDGSNLKLLDAGNAWHSTTLSPTRQFLVDNQTRVDRAPQIVLRDSTGAKVMDLEKPDLSRLTEYGWKPPETFTVKAADGVTDLYGNLWKPFDFDPKKKYPIIAHVYPGPQQEGVAHTFSVYRDEMQLAQLGFIVIQVGHRGGAPTRSKAYASFGYYNLRDYGLADKKAAIEALAARHSWIDLQKVGIYGHSGGGFMSAAALLQKPYNEFFKAGVATSGNHDNNIYNHGWGERYHGLKEVVVKADSKSADKTKRPSTPAAPPVKKGSPPVKVETKSPGTPAAPPTKYEIKVPTNAELAANLKGRLLLVHGEIDDNVHPANTMRLVDALIKANKRFDMLLLPGKRHGFEDYSGYIKQRTQEFFAEHLLGDRRRGADLDDKEKE